LLLFYASAPSAQAPGIRRLPLNKNLPIRRGEADFLLNVGNPTKLTLCPAELTLSGGFAARKRPARVTAVLRSV